MPAKKYFTEDARVEARREQTRKRRARMGRKAFRAECRDSAFRHNYGITLSERDEVLRLQAGLCNLCTKPMRDGRGADSIHIDHDHQTGRVRGLICDPLILRAAADYLEMVA